MICNSASSRLRKKRFEKFLTLLNVDGTCSILDVGGTAETWAGSGLNQSVTLLNLQTPLQKTHQQGFRYVQGDACDMHMFADKSFDIIFSNSVIEHVGSFENQKRFAGEVRRVGRSYWIQTPNRYFPIEPHSMFPYSQFMPAGIQKRIALNWKFSHFKKWKLSDERIIEELSRIRLLSVKEMNRLFADGQIYKEMIFGLVKSLVSYKLQ